MHVPKDRDAGQTRRQRSQHHRAIVIAVQKGNFISLQFAAKLEPIAEELHHSARRQEIAESVGPTAIEVPFRTGIADKDRKAFRAQPLGKTSLFWGNNHWLEVELRKAFCDSEDDGLQTPERVRIGLVQANSRGC